MFGQPDPCVVIAGDGIAAAAAACVLRDKGFGVVMVAPRGAGRRRAPIIEALPASAAATLADIGLASALTAARPVSVAGFSNRLRGQNRELVGAWTHVDRGELARRCRAQARRRGAITLRDNNIGSPSSADDEAVQIRLAGTTGRVFAVIDATGRAARWSRPVASARPATATLYRGPAAPSPRPGIIFAHDDTAWAYRLEHPHATTVGVISEHTARRLPLTDELAAGLAIDRQAPWVAVGVRSASVQWALDPIHRRRITIGDAALAHSPSAGHGVRFALSSALAAAAVLTTWAQSPAASATLASTYYRDFIDGARRRHLTNLAHLLDPPAPVQPDPPVIDPGARIRFCAPSRIVGQNLGGRIVAGEGYVLTDGALTRWVGGIDLAVLREAATGEPDLPELLRALESRGVSGTSALALIGWALRNGALDQPASAPTRTQAGETTYTS